MNIRKYGIIRVFFRGRSHNERIAQKILCQPCRMEEEQGKGMLVGKGREADWQDIHHSQVWTGEL